MVQMDYTPLKNQNIEDIIHDAENSTTSSFEVRKIYNTALANLNDPSNEVEMRSQTDHSHEV